MTPTSTPGSGERVKPRYTVDGGWGRYWFVSSTNGRTVAECHSERMARLIARLLNAHHSRPT